MRPIPTISLHRRPHLRILASLDGYDDRYKRQRHQLESQWISTRIRGEDIRMLMFKKWNTVFDVCLSDIDGHSHFCILVCDETPPAIELLPKLDVIADTLNRWNASGVMVDRLKQCHLDVPDEHGRELCDDKLAFNIPLDVTGARMSEFDVE